MLKKVAGIVIALSLMIAPFAQAGSFNGGSSTKSSTSTSTPSTSKVNLSKPSTSSSTGTSSTKSGSFNGGSSTVTTPTTSTPSVSSTKSGSFNGGSSTVKPSTSTNNTGVYKTGYRSPSSNVTSVPRSTQFGYVNGQRTFSWSSPSTFGVGLASGLVFGSMFHPFGGYYGHGDYYGYQPVSTFAIIFDLIILALFIAFIIWLIRRVRK